MTRSPPVFVPRNTASRLPKSTSSHFSFSASPRLQAVSMEKTKSGAIHLLRHFFNSANSASYSPLFNRRSRPRSIEGLRIARTGFVIGYDHSSRACSNTADSVHRSCSAVVGLTFAKRLSRNAATSAGVMAFMFSLLILSARRTANLYFSCAAPRLLGVTSFSYRSNRSAKVPVTTSGGEYSPKSMERSTPRAHFCASSRVAKLLATSE